VNRKYKDLDKTSLFDKLAQFTAVYTKLLNENGTSQAKDECKKTIHKLLAEINIRESEEQSGDPANRLIR
jgi:hypothetical protein